MFTFLALAAEQNHVGITKIICHQLADSIAIIAVHASNLIPQDMAVNKSNTPGFFLKNT
jgi:hypothetical protein